MKRIYSSYLIVAMLLFIGCKAEPTSTTRLRWFEDSKGFAGTVSIGFSDAEAIFANYPEYPKVTLFWSINGVTGQVAVPRGSVYNIAWSSTVRGLVLNTLTGVYVVDHQSGTLQAIWQKDLLKPKWATDPSGRFVLVTAYDIDRDAECVAMVDLDSKSTLVHYIDEYVTGIAFVGDDTAVVSTPSEILTVRYGGEAGLTCDASAEHEMLGWVVGATEGAPVYLSDTGTIATDQHSVAVAGNVNTFLDGEGAILLITTEGDVYRIDPAWRCSRVASFDVEDIIGRGASSNGVWVATKAGSVTVFHTDGRTEIHDIQVPQSPSR